MRDYDLSHIAEAHDIGKLFVRGLKHNLEDVLNELKINGIKEEWPVVQAILRHHCKQSPEASDIQLYPNSYETLLVHLADTLASQASRILKKLKGELKGLGINYCVYRLWKGPICQSENPPLCNRHEVLIDYLKKDPEGKEFLHRFQSYLLQRAEDAKKGANITSLYSHSILSGKFFRIIYKYYYNEIREMKVDFSDRKSVYDQAHNILNRLPLALIYLRMIPSQYIYRVRDLNVFEIIRDILSSFESNYQDHVLYRGYDDILIIDVPKVSIHKEIIQKAHKYGFYVDVHALYTFFQKNSDRVLGIEPIKIAKRFKIQKCREEVPKKECFENIYQYPPLEKKISPPICDICQLRPAVKTWIDEESGLIEHLCEECYRVRMHSSRRLYKLARWSEGRVAWIRISLDIEALEKALIELYIKYLTELGIKDADRIASKIEEEEGIVSPTLLQEFLWDYNEFIKDIGREILNLFAEENIEVIDDSFYIVKVERTPSIVFLIENYNSLLRKYFPRLVVLEDIEPIRLGISISHVKYPFHEHWRILSSMGRGFLLHIFRRSIVEATYKELNATLRFYRSREIIKRKQTLYRAIDIAEYSKLLADVELRKSLRYVPRDTNLQLLRMLLELEK